MDSAYFAVTFVCTTGWLVLGQRLAEQTGLRRQVWLANDFQGAPVIDDVAPLRDARLSGRRPAAATRVHQRPVARVLVRSEPSVVHNACLRGRLRRYLDRQGTTVCSEFRCGAGGETGRRRPRAAGCLPTVRWRRPISRSTGGSGDAYPLPLRTGHLFPSQPEPDVLRLATIVDRLWLTVGTLWATGALGAALFILRRRRPHVVCKTPLGRRRLPGSTL